MNSCREYTLWVRWPARERTRASRQACDELDRLASPKFAPAMVNPAHSTIGAENRPSRFRRWRPGPTGCYKVLRISRSTVKSVAIPTEDEPHTRAILPICLVVAGCPSSNPRGQRCPMDTTHDDLDQLQIKNPPNDFVDLRAVGTPARRSSVHVRFRTGNRQR